jgi:hypothetical protein
MKLFLEFYAIWRWWGLGPIRAIVPAWHCAWATWRYRP